jgi:hypothetical protein
MIEIGKYYKTKQNNVVRCYSAGCAVATVSDLIRAYSVYRANGESVDLDKGKNIVSECTPEGNPINIPQKLTKQQTINKVIEGFDFEKVGKTMKLLGWTWAYSWTEDKIPAIGELVVEAQKHLGMVYDGCLNQPYGTHYLSGSGGFTAYGTRYEDGEIVLELAFRVTEFNYSTQDTCY